MDYAEAQRQHWNSASGHAWVAIAFGSATASLPLGHLTAKRNLSIRRQAFSCGNAPGCAQCVIILPTAAGSARCLPSEDPGRIVLTAFQLALVVDARETGTGCRQSR